MGTPAGIFAMLRKDVNKCFRDMLNEYGQFLKSPASVSVLNKNPEGWLNEQALKIMTKVAVPNPPPVIPERAFWEVYQCSRELPSFGFKSWDDFFIRKFREGVRPIYKPGENQYITNCCESGPYALKTGVKLQDEFWLKGQPYSLEDMLGGVKYAAQFVGGTLYQAFLSALSYHCWHAPVSGTVVEIINIPGSYYAENYWKGFANLGPDGVPNPDPAAPNNSQGYICQVATRSVMILRADNAAIGEMAIVEVGMAEVSTCEWYLQPGDHFNKGDLIGAVS
jgi:phosphatidylserine decarboxylase